MAGDRGSPWVLLSYRMPREPSTPRIAVWRQLDRLGAARLGDGLVGLPANARTREQIDWIADEIGEAGGSATVWLARPASLAHQEAVIAALLTARAAEYQAVIDRARAAAGGTDDERGRAHRQLRRELHRIDRRDFYPGEHHEVARQAVEALGTPAPPARARTRG